MTFKLLMLLLLSFCLTSSLVAQDPQLEQLLEQQKQYSDISELIELLAKFEKEPIDLNRATAEQLAQLPWISTVLAVAIVKYRTGYGRFRQVDDLQKIPGFNPELLPILKKYVTVAAQKKAPELDLSTRVRVSRNLEGNNTPDNYLLPFKTYQRLILTYGNHIRMGGLLEKDRDERRLDDLRLFFVEYHDRFGGNQLILGNYRLEFGWGLVFGNPYAFFKGTDPIYPAKRRGRGMLGYTLVDENASLYGLSGQFCSKIHRFVFFISSAKLDASLDSRGYVTNFYRSGYHRTSAELNRKDQLSEDLFGARLFINPTDYFSMGLTYYQSRFDRPVARSNNSWQRFAFAGKMNELVGMDFSLTVGQFNWFGEMARSKNHGFGMLTGCHIDTRPLELVILVRNYSKNFTSFHANSFREQGQTPQNEQGVYFGVELRPRRRLKFSLYFDQFRFPWRTYRLPMPSGGKELFFRTKYKPMKNLALSLKFTSKQKDQKISGIPAIVVRHQKRLRFQVEFRPGGKLRFRNRIERSWTNYGDDMTFHRAPHFTGILLYQDISLAFSKQFDLAARITFFDTDGYESRIYQFEHDVPGILTNQMLYGTGSRWYFRFRWRISAAIRLSMKISSTQFLRGKTARRDLELITANSLNSIKLQLETNW